VAPKLFEVMKLIESRRVGFELQAAVHMVLAENDE